MIKNLKIKVTIGDRVYPLTIRDEKEEEGIRLAVKKINEMVKNFEQNYEVRDKQDVLAMCALQFASMQEVKTVHEDLDSKKVENKLRELNQLLDSHLA
jgi:cell division protein ZapA (FtsZ GTPase activity inhibitor)